MNFSFSFSMRTSTWGQIGDNDSNICCDISRGLCSNNQSLDSINLFQSQKMFFCFFLSNSVKVYDSELLPFHCTLMQLKKWIPLRPRAWAEIRAMYIWGERQTDGLHLTLRFTLKTSGLLLLYFFISELFYVGRSKRRTDVNVHRAVTVSWSTICVSAVYVA